VENNGAPGMNNAIAHLLAARDALDLADLQAALDSPALAAALAVITSATTTLNNTAGQMVSAANFIGKAATFGTQANAVAMHTRQRQRRFPDRITFWNPHSK
jgi:hypothetical protein